MAAVTRRYMPGARPEGAVLNGGQSIDGESSLAQLEPSGHSPPLQRFAGSAPPLLPSEVACVDDEDPELAGAGGRPSCKPVSRDISRKRMISCGRMTRVEAECRV
jgi:hypothetical protein